MRNSLESMSNLEDLLSFFHFYVSVIAGWCIFNKSAYPLAFLAKVSNPDLAGQLPIYALNVLAFSCLVYVATRPIVIVLRDMISASSNSDRPHGR